MGWPEVCTQLSFLASPYGAACQADPIMNPWLQPAQAALGAEGGLTGVPLEAVMWCKRFSGSLRQRHCIRAESQSLCKIVLGLFQDF